ncbi:MAG: L,D-transpeptidase family protein, partial [Chitinophagaceae bacterium]|nr:L,D-transpeptidase family protein [Chitinophagaceae bacterium]
MKQLILPLAAASLIIACTQMGNSNHKGSDSTGNSTSSDTTTAVVVRDESINEANAYSDLFLDNAAIDSFVRKENLNSAEASTLRRFYDVRSNQFAWLASDGLTEQGRGLWSLYAESGTPDKRLKEKMDTLLQQDSLMISKNDTSAVQLELTLTKLLFRYIQSNKKGIVNTSNVYSLVPRKKQDALQLADSILNKQTSTQYANNKDYNGLKQQLSIYYTAAKNGGWQAVSGKGLKKGVRSPAVIALKKRLAATGDYTTSDTSNIFSDSLATAIKDVQRHNGLASSGVVNDSLIKILNVPAEQRVEQILINLNRTLWMPIRDSNYIMVNIPSFTLYAYEGSNRIFEMPVVVGKEGTSTVMFSGKINQIVFNPTWNIPRSIVQNEILPKMKTDKSYLKKKNIEVVSEKDTIPTLRQLPGKDNPLGKVKFLFPNTFDIYLHDTPDRNLFKRKDRALSHGCIRVADPAKFAQYLLQNQSGWTENKIREAMNSGKGQTVAVKNTKVVYITYYTVW